MALTSHAIYPSLKDRVVLVTGGAEGIGAAMVELFCRQGAKIAFFDIADSSAEALVQHISKIIPQYAAFPVTVPTFYHCDVTDLDQLQAQADRVLADFGTIDVLVNNAAMAGSSMRVPTPDVTAATWELHMNVTLRHMFFLTQKVVPAMQTHGRGGAIVNMGSITWRIPVVGLPLYTLCKAGVVGMTRTHAHEFGKDKIRVNSIMPGAIATERQIREILTPEYRAEVFAAQALQRDLEPHEVARLCVFLCSDEASAITGSNYVIDGGYVGDP